MYRYLLCSFHFVFINHGVSARESFLIYLLVPYNLCRRCLYFTGEGWLWFSCWSYPGDKKAEGQLEGLIDDLHNAFSLFTMCVLINKVTSLWNITPLPERSLCASVGRVLDYSFLGMCGRISESLWWWMSLYITSFMSGRIYIIFWLW